MKIAIYYGSRERDDVEAGVRREQLESLLTFTAHGSSVAEVPLISEGLLVSC